MIRAEEGRRDVLPATEINPDALCHSREAKLPMVSPVHDHRLMLMLGLSLTVSACGQASSPGKPASGEKRAPSFAPVAEESPASQSVRSESAESAAFGGTPLPDEPPTKAPDRIYRPSDMRPRHAVERARELGIQRYASQRLELFTDIEPGMAEGLPPLVDQIYETWVNYFGPLPPDREGSEFQITGYLIREVDRFLAADMLPNEILSFQHGQHRGAEFWMYDQGQDYYRRHLLLHEATHCFMTIMPDVELPLWYLEGMAEFFATHTIDEEGHARFGVMPESSQRFIGFGRVQFIQSETEAGRFLDLDGVVRQGNAAFSQSRSVPYSWSWALCAFLDFHPRTQSRFRDLSHRVTGSDFNDRLLETFSPDKPLLQAEWAEFIRTLEYGFDIPRNAFSQAVETRDLELPLSATTLPVTWPLPLRTLEKSPQEVAIRADRGWQSIGVELSSGETVRISASGQTILGRQPKPWISEPQGISIRYADRAPLGLLQGAFLWLDGDDEGTLQTFPIGRGKSVSVPFRCALLLRVNDSPSEIADNGGFYHVIVERVPASGENSPDR